MSLANIVSAYVAFNLSDKIVGKFLRNFYEKERPGLEYGHPEWERFIARREDVPLIVCFLEANECYGDPNMKKLFTNSSGTFYTTQPIFLDSQIPEIDREGFVKNLGCEMISACQVCEKPLFSGAHKHIMQFCDKCGKSTKHTTPFFGQPFRCTEH